jgi:hypothetical protein
VLLLEPAGLEGRRLLSLRDSFPREADWGAFLRNGSDHISTRLHGGANEYIMKPFDKDIVMAKFQEVGLIAAPV